jgi:hypothetical protein
VRDMFGQRRRFMDENLLKEVRAKLEGVPAGRVRNLVSASRNGYFLSPFSDLETDTWMFLYGREPSS